MQHDIPQPDSQPQRRAMAHAVATCVHCGFCLPACPTYKVLGEEMDSPRGRIVLMKQVLEGTIDADEARTHIDRCLGCLACVTTCPSGVPYGELLVPYRAETERTRPAWQRIRRQLLLDTLESPSLFRMSARVGKVAQRFAALAPSSVKPMLALLPDRLPDAIALPALTPALGQRRARVALLAGCAQQVLAPAINQATIDVLSRNGIEVLVPPDQGCCGALAMHVGEDERAYARATTLMRAFPADVDAIVTNAAGCGSALKEYGHAFKGRAQHDALAAFSARVRDVTEVLDELGLVDPPSFATRRTVAYHDACHLGHAQGVRRPPRALLGQIGNLQVVEVP
ncbi:MAG TPA: heterodisulfide reductase-related iron-sulfur binding cluster, partial [Luteitalea sp.]|nr:heterodisulfide reductase-related iron-sulfur binding cluster [Luteitalea sp.]